jgi:hypothetical protein
MPLDTRSAYQSIFDRTDALLAKTASRVAASPVAAKADSKTAERVAAIDQAVAETDLAARSALNKLAAVQVQKTARRAEKIAMVRHIARVANTLLAS